MFGFFKKMFSPNPASPEKARRKTFTQNEILNDDWHDTTFPYQATILNIQRANRSYGSTCQIAIRYIENCKYKDYIRLVKPNTKSFSFEKYHGITQEDVADSPNFSDIWETIQPYFNNKNIVTYFADSHIKALKTTLNKNHIPLPSMNVIDLYEYFSEYHENWNSLSLDFVAEKLNTNSDPNPKRAKYTLDTINELLEIIYKKRPGRLKKMFNIKNNKK
nr:MAG TPA: DNA polymerase III [Caudoviricetes sp.]